MDKKLTDNFNFRIVQGDSGKYFVEYSSKTNQYNWKPLRGATNQGHGFASQLIAESYVKDLTVEGFLTLTGEKIIIKTLNEDGLLLG